MKCSHRWMSALACGMALSLAGEVSADVVSTFDTDLDGWVPLGVAVDTSAGALLSGNVILTQVNTGDMIHNPGGGAFDGNPGGFAELTDAITDPGSFASAPAKFLGNLTPFLGGTFSIDHRLFDQGTGATSVQPYAILFISGDPNNLDAYGTVIDGPTLGQGDTGWVNLSVTLEEGPGQQAVAEAIDALFASTTRLDAAWLAARPQHERWLAAPARLLAPLL